MPTSLPGHHDADCRWLWHFECCCEKGCRAGSDGPQCPVQLLRPSWSTSRFLAHSFVAPAPFVEYIASAPAMHAAPAPVVKFSCGKTCALWPASDVGLGERCCAVCLVARHGLLLACTHSTLQFARGVSFRGASNLGDCGFLVVRRNAHSTEIVARSREHQYCPNCSTWRHETHRAAFGNVKTTLRASLVQHAVPVLSAVSIFTCMLRAALHASASRISFSVASMRDNPRHGASHASSVDREGVGFALPSRRQICAGPCSYLVIEPSLESKSAVHLQRRCLFAQRLIQLYGVLGTSVVSKSGHEECARTSPFYVTFPDSAPLLSAGFRCSASVCGSPSGLRSSNCLTEFMLVTVASLFLFTSKVSCA